MAGSDRPGARILAGGATILREAYQRIKQAFDEAGIHFAHRQVTVFVPPGTTGPAAAGAAAAATEPRAESAS